MNVSPFLFNWAIFIIWPVLGIFGIYVIYVCVRPHYYVDIFGLLGTRRYWEHASGKVTTRPILYSK